MRKCKLYTPISFQGKLWMSNEAQNQDLPVLSYALKLVGNVRNILISLFDKTHLLDKLDKLNHKGPEATQVSYSHRSLE